MECYEDSLLLNWSAERFTNMRTTVAARHAEKGGVRSERNENIDATVRSADAMNRAVTMPAKRLPPLRFTLTDAVPQP